MEFLTIKSYCLSKEGSFEDYPFGPEPLVFKIQTKMFAIVSDKAGKTSISLKCDPFVALNLRQQYKSITPGYHLNKEHWITVLLDGSIPDSEVYWMVDHSYELVVSKL